MHDISCEGIHEFEETLWKWAGVGLLFAMLIWIGLKVSGIKLFEWQLIIVIMFMFFGFLDLTFKRLFIFG